MTVKHCSPLRRDPIDRCISSITGNSCLIGVLVCAALTLSTVASSLNDDFEHAYKASKIEIPLYLKCPGNHAETTFEIGAVICIENLDKDFQRRGFFRIGVLPLLVLNGMTIEVLDTRRTAEAFAKANAKLKARRKSGACVEGRSFSVCFGNEPNATLQAAVVHFRDEETWALDDGSIEAEGSTHRFKTAVFHVEGNQAGELTFRSDDRVFHLNVFHLPGKSTAFNK